MSTYLSQRGYLPHLNDFNNILGKHMFCAWPTVRCSEFHFRKSAALIAPLAALACSWGCYSESKSFHTYHAGEFPPPMADEVEEVVREAAEKRGFHLFVQDKGVPGYDDVERLSLWVHPSEEATKQSVMTLFRMGSVISIGTYEGEDWATADVDLLFAEVKDGLESRLGLTLCAKDLVRGICRRSAEARRLYRMDFDGGAFEMPR